MKSRKKETKKAQNQYIDILSQTEKEEKDDKEKKESAKKSESKKSEPAPAEDKKADEEAGMFDETVDTAMSDDVQAEAISTTVQPNLDFKEEDGLVWPIVGDVLINYSMDQTVYFSTLEQYKYNPALIIGGEVGETIAASAPGIVTNVEQDAQTGLTVTLDMGNGYTAVYGQLKEVPVQIGDYVDTGATIGYLSEPTKYFSMEGPNLYFEILKDETPVNPLDFIEG